MNEIIAVIERAVELLPAPVWVGAGLLLLESALIVFGTHFVKRRILPYRLRRTWVIRFVALALGVLPMVRYWPGGAEQGFYVGLAGALFWLFAYDAAMNRLYARYPELVERYSAQPERGCY